MSDLQETFHNKYIRPILGKISHRNRHKLILFRLKDTDTSLGELYILYANLLSDIVDDGEAIRRIASPYLTDFELNGDSYGVPSNIDIVESLVKKLDKGIASEN